MGDVREITRHPAGSLRVTLGIVAHDAKKDELSVFARAHRNALRSLRLMAPEDTALALAEVGVEAQMLARGTEGGDLQLAAAVVDGTVDAVIFLRDPLIALAGEPHTAPLMKVCDLARIPFATNIASAEIVVRELSDHRGLPYGVEIEPPPGLDTHVMRLGVSSPAGRRSRGRGAGRRVRP
jgi:methylglyoxal synthase